MCRCADVQMCRFKALSKFGKFYVGFFQSQIAVIILSKGVKV